MKTLIIARHGNTFRKGETPTRVGARTDLDLVENERGEGIGLYLGKIGLIPSRVIAAPLKRTLKTAALAAEAAGCTCPIQPDSRFIEVDYGPDENKTEEEVKTRLGREKCLAEGIDPETCSPEHIDSLGASVIERWNKEAAVPPGWLVDVDRIRRHWIELANEVKEGEIVLCVSSNGAIRFAPVITGDYAEFCATHDIKVPTGGLCIFTREGEAPWQCKEWGTKAFKHI